MSDLCEINYVNEKRVKNVKKSMHSEENLYDMAELFKVLGDPTRARLLNAISIEELCVCDLASLLNMKHSAISHQLKTLRINKIVKKRKEGKMVYYSFDDEHIQNIFNEALKHIKHIKH